MRVNLPMMLAASVALHGTVATGLALNHFYSARMAASPESLPPTTIVLLSDEEVTGMPTLAPKRHATPPPVPAPSAAVAVSTAPPVIHKMVSISPPAPPAPTLALEANPNAHIRSLPPAAVLCPNPAPPVNSRDGIVFILDISGSMYEPFAGSTRLAMAREVLSRHILALKDGTPFAITVYSQTARTSGPLVAASDATREAAVRFIKEDIDCGGGTCLPAGLASAMELNPGHLVLVSDGDLNTSLTDLMSKTRDIIGTAGHGPALTVVPVAPRADSDAVALLKGIVNLEKGTYLNESPQTLLSSAAGETSVKSSRQ